MAKVFKKYDVSAVQREYEQDGAKKKFRRQVGEMTVFQGDDGTYFYKMSLYHMPGVEIDLYEQKAKENDNY